MKKQRTHRVTLTVTFDKPCGSRHATSEVKDCIWGDYYPTSYNDEDPCEFKVRSVVRAPKSRRTGR